MSKKNPIYSDKIIYLKETQPFAQGGNRLCFVHPDNNALCIKILKPGKVAELRAKRSFFKKFRTNSYFDDNANEYKAYQQSAIKRGAEHVYTHIPRCYGWQKTDQGRGLVLDYYQQKSGLPCKTLEHYLHEHGFTAEIQAKLNDLADYLRSTRLMTKNIIPHNVVLAGDETLKIIDGIGTSSPLNIANISKAAKTHYINRRIDRMFLRARWESSDKETNWTTIEKQGHI